MVMFDIYTCSNLSDIIFDQMYCDVCQAVFKGEYQIFNDRCDLIFV